jgi:Uma2 family endonuclease
VRVRRGKFREPDVLYVSHGRKMEERFSHGSDLVVEIVSGDDEDRQRDLVEKRKDYAVLLPGFAVQVSACLDAPDHN